jgi:predicted PolB exonuclease-like 3'-5' exonuclease
MQALFNRLKICLIYENLSKHKTCITGWDKRMQKITIPGNKKQEENHHVKEFFHKGVNTGNGRGPVASSGVCGKQ